MQLGDLIGVIASIAVLLAARSGQVRVGRRILANVPPEVAQDERVVKRYSALRLPIRPLTETRALAASGWSLFLVAFFTVAAAIGATMVFLLAFSTALAVFWAASDWEQAKQAETRFWGELGELGRQMAPTPRRFSVVHGTLITFAWIAWLWATAFLGHAIGTTIG